jgi:DNA-binding LacI/PurR family transcriptional regulator/DNA-binding transcriptional regulator YhcF (GntR family)
MKVSHESHRSIPVYLTLTDQTAECLRRRIDDGTWTGMLPSEAEICREMGISRGTLRRAMATLLSEGMVISGGRGGRHRVAESARVTRSDSVPESKGHIVRVLSPQPRFIITSQTQIVFQTMSESLGRKGLHLEFEHHPGLLKLRHPNSALKKITAQPNTAGWVLYRSTYEVQQWFEKSDIPSVVIGGKFPDIELSHAEFDLVAASRHGAGVFAARKHKRMVFLTVDTATAGDRASAEAFVTAAAAAGAYAETAVYNDTVPGLCRALDGLLLSNPVPTAFFVAIPNHVPATIGHLTRRGFHVPERAAVISRMDAQLLAEAIPSVARYSTNGELLGRGAARLLERAIKSPVRTSIGNCIIMPEFVDGETAGAKRMSY